MYHLRLVKALSYTGYGLSVTKKNPDVTVKDSATALALVATGYFQLLENEESPLPDDEDGANDPVPDGIIPDSEENGENSKSDDEKPQGKTLDEMSRAELETFATYKNVSVKGLSKKADIVAKLREVLGPEEASGIIEYGSPTMAELQQQ